MTPLEALAVILTAQAAGAISLTLGYAVGTWWTNRAPQAPQDLLPPVHITLHADVRQYADAMTHAARTITP
ncbi:hypothetical protein [Microbacterium sp.]|uniref:hypothetical protein n=1 Tax=Microbacterium sp. TaxID=51671 RepID=UPI0039E691BD